jgi:UDP-glucose 4-epimerase
MQEAFHVKGSRFLITGGTGSFGQVMVKRLLDEGASMVRVISRDESKQFELQNRFADSRLDLMLVDIREPNATDYALRGIDYVFHAAALKHVPASEENPFEYVKTNVYGSHSLLKSLQGSQVKTAVFLSTDKAVYPVNAMGMSKALMEKLVRSSSYDSPVNSCITRYGNVIGSRGSVIPYLIKSIKHRTPINITDWSMTRFIMSLDDSVNLVLHAMSCGKSGDLFVQKAPAARLDTMLQSLEEILGLSASEIKVTGPRPGEKMHETLLNSEERTESIESQNYFHVPSITKRYHEETTGIRYDDEFTSSTTQLLNKEALVKVFLQNSELQKLFF